MMADILIADDEKKMRHLLSMILESEGHRVEQAEDGKTALLKLLEQRFDMVISDIKMPEMDGIELLAAIKKAGIPCPVIYITAFATIDSAVEMMRMGASDYISKPFDSEQILLAVARTLNVSQIMEENKALKDDLRLAGKKDLIIHASSQMTSLLDLAKDVAQTDSAVLIQGESGTGKELLARFLHRNSPRAKARFVPVNCAAISSSLVESELFGHEKGAFTGAEKMAKGKFEFASGGTIFLDEIGDLPLDAQAKLLRVLQEKCITRVGANTEIDVDVRVLCATNKDLEALVAEDKFRQDLFYRINVVPIEPPPLRERRDDIIPLAKFFIQRLGRDLDLDPGARQVLTSHNWPGNVRELLNAVERAAILNRRKNVLGADSFAFIKPGAASAEISETAGGFALPETGVALEMHVSDLVKQALEKANGNQSGAARLLGVTRAKFRVLVKQAEDCGVL